MTNRLFQPCSLVCTQTSQKEEVTLFFSAASANCGSRRDGDSLSTDLISSTTYFDDLRLWYFSFCYTALVSDLTQVVSVLCLLWLPVTYIYKEYLVVDLKDPSMEPNAVFLVSVSPLLQRPSAPACSEPVTYNQTITLLPTCFTKDVVCIRPWFIQQSNTSVTNQKT